MKNILKKVLTILLAISIMVLANIPSQATTATTTFKDIKTTAWYYTYVNKLVELKITSGIGNNKYGPANSVTRAEFVTFLCKTKGYTQTKGDPFTDTQKSWASGYITIALANGIIDLPTDKKCRPDDAITRLEAVEMMCRALNISKDTTTQNPYADVKTITGYTNAAYANYLMQGSIEKNVRYFKPSDKISRAEAAAVIVNAYNYNTDKMAFLNAKITAANEKAAKEKTEAEKYQVWLNSMDKGISTQLLKNTTGLEGGKTVQICNEYAAKELEEFTYWMKDSNLSNLEDFKEEFVRVARNFTTLYYNRNYTKLDVLDKGLKEQWASIKVENYLQETLNKTKNNKVVKEGQLFTGKGLLVINDQSPVLRGTLKYRYLKPTDKKMFGTDICIDTGKPCEYNTWYEVDVEVTFIPENGLKVQTVNEISSIRLWR